MGRACGQWRRASLPGGQEGACPGHAVAAGLCSSEVPLDDWLSLFLLDCLLPSSEPSRWLSAAHTACPCPLAQAVPLHWGCWPHLLYSVELFWGPSPSVLLVPGSGTFSAKCVLMGWSAGLGPGLFLRPSTK